MERVILVAGSFTSANVNVMLSVIRAIREKPEIHIIAVNYFKDKFLSSEDGVYYHPVSSLRWRITQKLQGANRCKLLCKCINAMIYYTFRIIDNFIPNGLEREMFKKGCELPNISQVYSVCDPFYTHRVAHKIADIKKLQWFPVWLDSYSNGFCKRSLLWELSSLYYEKKIFEAAPRIFALEPSFLGNKLISDYTDKVRYFRIPYIRNIQVKTVNKSIIYAGLLGDANRNPYPILELFLETLSDLQDDVTFHFYVRNPYDYFDYQERSNNRIQFHSFVSREELQGLLSESFMLLNIGNAISFQLPSKVIENISYRKPILFFYSQEKDPSFEYFNDYPDIFVQNINSVSPGDIKRFVDFVNKEHCTISYSDIISNQVFKECTPEYVKDIFMK